MEILTVGKPYIEGKTGYQEGLDFNYRCATYELRMFLARPQPHELDDILHGPVRFSLATVQNAIFLCVKFGGQQWMDASFNINLVPQDQRSLPTIEPLMHALLHIIVIDSVSGVVAGLRVISLSVPFTQALAEAIIAQAMMPWNEEDYLARIARIYSSRSSGEIARSLARTHCDGGT